VIEICASEGRTQLAKYVCSSFGLHRIPTKLFFYIHKISVRNWPILTNAFLRKFSTIRLIARPSLPVRCCHFTLKRKFNLDADE